MEILIGALCFSQCVQGAALVAIFWKLREHDLVIVGLPELLKERDQAMVTDFKKATFEAISELMEKRADKKSQADLDATSRVLGRARRRTEGEKS